MTPLQIIKENHKRLNKNGFFETYNLETATYQCIKCTKERVYMILSMGKTETGYTFNCPDCFWGVTGIIK